MSMGSSMKSSMERENGTVSVQRNHLATMDIPKLIISLAVPAIVAQIINALYNIVDRIYISRIPGVGALALTGVGVCFPILILISAFAQLVGVGGATLAAIEMGKRNMERAQRLLGNGFMLLIVMSVCLTAVFQIGKYPILMMFGASPSTVGFGIEYLSVYLWGTLFVQMTLGLNPFITGQGKSKIAMLSILIGAGLNVLLDPLFIFVFHMGVRGAAVATVLSQIASALWILRFLMSSRSLIHIHAKYMRLRFEIVSAMMALGVSSFIMAFTECVIQIVFNSGLQVYGGDDHVAAMTIIQSAMQIVFIFSTGITQGVQPVISFNYGARLFERVRAAYRIGFVCHIMVAVTSCVLLAVFPGFFGSIFTDRAEILDIIRSMFPIYICGWGIFGIQSAVQCTFVGLGEAKLSLFFACLRKIILLVPLALILPRFFGYPGIFAAEPISDITSAVTAGILFKIRISSILKEND